MDTPPRTPKRPPKPYNPAPKSSAIPKFDYLTPSSLENFVNQEEPPEVTYYDVKSSPKEAYYQIPQSQQGVAFRAEPSPAPFQTESPYEFLDGRPSSLQASGHIPTARFESVVVLPNPPIRKDSRIKRSVKRHKIWVALGILLVLLVVAAVLVAVFLTKSKTDKSDKDSNQDFNITMSTAEVSTITTEIVVVGNSTESKSRNVTTESISPSTTITSPSSSSTTTTSHNTSYLFS